MIIIIICGSLPVVVVATNLLFDSPKMKNQKKHKAFAEQPSEYNSRRLLCWLEITEYEHLLQWTRNRQQRFHFTWQWFSFPREGERERESRGITALLWQWQVWQLQPQSKDRTKVNNEFFTSGDSCGWRCQWVRATQADGRFLLQHLMWQLPSAPTCPHMPFQHALRTRCHAVPDSKHKNQTSQHTHKHTLRWAGLTPVWGERGGTQMELLYLIQLLI